MFTNGAMSPVRRLAVTALAGVLVAAACTSSATPSAPPASQVASVAPATPTAGPPYKVAVTVPLSGTVAEFGLNVQNGVTLASEQINKAGGAKGRQFAPEFLDTKCNPTEASNVAATVASRGDFFAVIGDLCSADVLSMLPILDRAGITMISPGASSARITDVIKDKGYQGWVRLAPRDLAQGEQMVRLAVTILQKKKLGVLYASDEYGQALFAAIKDAAGLQGATIAGSETFTPSQSQTKDFTPQLTRLKDANPEVILMAGFAAELGPAVNQMPRAGLTAPVITSAGATQGNFTSLAGAPAEGVYVLGLYDAAAWTSEPITKFIADYKARFNKNPDFNSVTSYTATKVLEQAILNGATRETLGAVARQVVLSGTPIGTVRFSQYGDVNTQMLAVFVVKSGALVPNAELTTKLIGG